MDGLGRPYAGQVLVGALAVDHRYRVGGRWFAYGGVSLMPGDKWPEHTPDIGWGGLMVLLALIVVFLLAAFGWMFF